MYRVCITDFSCCCDKVPERSNLGTVWPAFFREQSFMVRKAWWLEHETAGESESMVQKQREMNAGAQPTVSFLHSQGAKPMGRQCPQTGWVFPLC